MKISWKRILSNWDLVEADLLQVYGADWADPMLDRSWPWWRRKILGLFSTDSRIARLLMPPSSTGATSGG